MANRRKDLNIASSNLWYLVGLITTDGCLSSDGRHIDITAKEHDFLAKIERSLGITNKICLKNNGAGDESYRVVLSNRNFYEFLLSIGLTPCKSLTQDEVIVQDDFFHDFLRGVIDGDGSIRNWKHSSNKREQWSLRIYSSSLKFVEWLQKEVEYSFKAKGRVHRYEKEKPRADMFVLKYGKLAAQVILAKCYYDNALALDRKARLAKECCASLAGWKQSKTVLN
jgi:hypothetical protein